ncbi:MAG: hypothetical protein HQL48_09285 [Gammaproteobacteria bacterium]|nr:hypothetical protein [Gammaproteobacteria bacterium]
MMTWLDSTQTSLSEDLLQYSSRIDSYFVGDGSEQQREDNRSRLEIGVINTLYEGGVNELRHRVAARIDLPRTQNRLKLEIRGDGEEGINGVAEGGDGAEEKRLSIGLRYQKLLLEKIKFRVRGGVRASGGGLNPYIRLRGGLSFGVGSGRLTLSENLFREHITGSGYSSRVQFTHPVRQGLDFYSTSAVTWFNDEGHFQLNQDLYLVKALKKRHLLTAQVGADGLREYQHQRVESYYLRLSYRRPLYREWLIAEATPEIRFRRESGFSKEHLLLLKLVAIIGGNG